jgi:hypothetical protein
MIKAWLDTYHPRTINETRNALRQIMQEVALAGLYRAGFFKYAAFYGGTALRIFHDLPRFSEDLDFSLIKKNSEFSILPFLDAIILEFNSLGMKVSVQEKKKSLSTQIDSAFLKTDTIWKELSLEASIPQLSKGIPPAVKIKLEVDTMPPLGFSTENALLIRPFSFYVNCFSLPSLFAGKMHALLFRKWANREKGRDWFDIEWFIQKGIALDFNHFLIRSQESSDISSADFQPENLLNLLVSRIESVNLNHIKEDVIRFLPPGVSTPEIWSREYFRKLIAHLQWI